jgi:hypothetical protein
MNKVKSIFLVMIICAVVFVLTGCERTEEAEQAESKTNTEKTVLSNEEMYSDLIENYEKALAEFDLESLESEEEIKNKYGIEDLTLIMHIARYAEDGLKLTKEFYDVDKNGIDELILGAENAIGVIYSFDTSSNKPVFIFALDTLERGSASIYDNGTIFSGGAGGAMLHVYEFGKISENGTSYELLEKVEEEYIEDNEVPEYRDSATGRKLEYKSLDEVIDKYINNAEVVDVFN